MEAAVLIAVVALAFVSTLPSFEAGQIASWDGPAHMVLAEHFESSLNSESLGVFGWYHGWYLGVASFLFYPPGFSAVLSLMKAATFGLASTSLTMKALVATTFTGFPAALFWSGRALGLTRRAAVFAAALSLGCSAYFGVGIEGLYRIGLYTQAFSLVLFLGFLGLLLRCLRDQTSPVPAGLMLAAVFLTSVITAVFTTVAAPLAWLASGGWRRAGLARFAAVFAVALPCAAFWLFPFVRSLPLAGPMAGFSALTLGELLRRLPEGGVVLPPETAVLATLGAGVCLARWRRGPEPATHGTLLTLFVATLLLGSSLPAELVSGGWPGRLLGGVLRVRALVFLWIFGPLLAGVAAEATLDLAGRGRVRLSRGLLILAYAALLGFGAKRLSDHADSVRTLEHPAFTRERQEWRPALAWLRANAPPGSVVLPDVNWGGSLQKRLGTTSIDSLINLEAGLRTVRGNQIEASQLELRLDRLRFRTPADEEPLRRFGADYVLMYQKPFYWPPYLEPVYMSERLVIYRVLPGAVRPLLKLELFANRCRARVRVDEAQSLELPIQYNDHWSARVGGELRAVSRSELGLVLVPVPAGESVVELAFRRSTAETSACVLSLLSLAASLALLGRGRRRPPSSA